MRLIDGAQRMCPDFKPRHEQVRTSQDVMVDTALAPLLEALWRHRIKTTYSCQNNYDGGTGYIAFSSAFKAWRFARSCQGACIYGLDRRCVEFPFSKIGSLTQHWRKKPLTTRLKAWLHP